jgi:hypothetical protein
MLRKESKLTAKRAQLQISMAFHYDCSPAAASLVARNSLASFALISMRWIRVDAE